MPRDIEKLTAAKIAGLKVPGRYLDGWGLILQIAEGGSKSWILRYQLCGRSREMGLGGLSAVSLKQARERARAARNLLVDGIDPIDVRRAKKDTLQAEQAKKISFKECAEKYIAAHAAGWKNLKHAQQWPSSFATYVYPIIGNLSVDAVDTAHVVRILEPIWNTKTETASRVRGRVEAVLDWARARHYRSGDNPARWRGHLDNLFPHRAKVRARQHQPAMPYDDLPGFIAELNAGPSSVSAAALEFTILTAARTAEAIGARWDEIDVTKKVWTVPAARTKSSREHRVPLSDRAVALLNKVPKEKGSPWVFPGGRDRKPLSNMAMLELLRGLRPGLTVHGFRSSFRDWAAERTNYPREVAEAALAHVLKDKTEAAYQRGDLFEKRRRLMSDWARFCTAAPVKAKGGNVTPLRRAK